MVAVVSPFRGFEFQVLIAVGTSIMPALGDFCVALVPDVPTPSIRATEMPKASEVVRMICSSGKTVVFDRIMSVSLSPILAREEKQ
jgi:hypothetical protein